MRPKRANSIQRGTDRALTRMQLDTIPVDALDARPQVFEQRLIRNGSVHLQPAQGPAPVSANMVTAPRGAA